jgi:hypothetical protein
MIVYDTLRSQKGANQRAKFSQPLKKTWVFLDPMQTSLTHAHVIGPMSMHKVYTRRHTNEGVRKQDQMRTPYMYINMCFCLFVRMYVWQRSARTFRPAQSRCTRRCPPRRSSAAEPVSQASHVSGIHIYMTSRMHVYIHDICIQTCKCARTDTHMWYS